MNHTDSRVCVCNGTSPSFGREVAVYDGGNGMHDAYTQYAHMIRKGIAETVRSIAVNVIKCDYTT